MIMKKNSGFWKLRCLIPVASFLIVVSCAPWLSAQNGPNDLSQLIISDDNVSDYILAGDSNAIDGKRVKFRLELKYKSLKMRLTRATELIDIASKRFDTEEMNAQKCRDAASRLISDSPSMTINDQLLYAALLEHQKTSWDVAAERVLVESQLADAKPSAEIFDLDTEIAILEVDRLAKARELSRLEYEQNVNGNTSELETQKSKNEIEKEEIDLAIGRAKLKMIPIRKSAVEKQVPANASEQLLKLLARKKEIEGHIKLHQSVRPDVLARERLRR